MKSDFNDLFYNLVPGGFFSFIWIEILKTKFGAEELIKNSILPQSETLKLTLFIIFSFIIGFFIHSIWSIAKKAFKFERYLFFCCNKNLEDNFNKKNRELKLPNQIRFAHFFSDRSAYWANFGLGFFITLTIYLFSNNVVRSIWIISIIIAIIVCFASYYNYRKKEIDTVMER